MEVCIVSIMAASQISSCGTADCNKVPGWDEKALVYRDRKRKQKENERKSQSK